jgi:uncharacterized protein YegJ (DUF2314 family)
MTLFVFLPQLILYKQNSSLIKNCWHKVSAVDVSLHRDCKHYFISIAKVLFRIEQDVMVAKKTGDDTYKFINDLTDVYLIIKFIIKTIFVQMN